MLENAQSMFNLIDSDTLEYGYITKESEQQVKQWLKKMHDINQKNGNNPTEINHANNMIKQFAYLCKQENAKLYNTFF